MLTVVIPTHNRLAELKLALTSLYEQTTLPDEIIVVDDGSTTPVSEEIFKYCPGKVKCKLIRNYVAKGAGAARNKGILSAACSWIAFLDDDDTFKVNKIHSIKQNIEKIDADFIYHSAEILMVEEDVSYRTQPPKIAPEDDIFKLLLISNKFGGTPVVVAKKDLLISAGLFNEKINALEDYELWIRVAKSGARFHLVEEPLTKCRYISKKASVSKSIKANENALEYIEKLYGDYYSAFSKEELIEHELWKGRLFVHKALLNKNMSSAVKKQISIFFKYRSLKDFLSIFVILMGRRFMYKLRAKISV